MDWVFHYLIPVLLLYFLGIRHKFLFGLGFLAWFPDLEKFLGYGRVIFHNIFFVLLATALIYVFLSAKKFSDKVKVTLLSGFFLLSHLILDFGGPIKILYPLSSKFFELELAVRLVNRQIPMLFFQINTYDFLPVAQSPFIVTTEGFLIALMLIGIFLVVRFSKKK